MESKKNISTVHVHKAYVPFYITGYVNVTSKQIIPYHVQRGVLETQCPEAPDNFTSEMCSGDKMCLYDLYSTGDILMAHNTLISYQRYLTSKAVFSKGAYF